MISELPKAGIFLASLDDSLANYAALLAELGELGLTWVRFNLPLADNEDLADKIVAQCEELGITLVAGLSGFATTDLRPDFPFEFATAVAGLTGRYPSIRHYSLIHEPYAAASVWENEADFVRAVNIIAKAVVLGRKAVTAVRDDWRFFQDERLELTTAIPGSGREAEAHAFNRRRFAALDLIFGHHDPVMENYLLERGLPQAEYAWFMDHGQSDDTILGVDYSTTTTRTLGSDLTEPLNHLKPAQLLPLIAEYEERYPLPLLFTLSDDDADAADPILRQLIGHSLPVVGLGWHGARLNLLAELAVKGLPVSKFAKTTRNDYDNNGVN